MYCAKPFKPFCFVYTVLLIAILACVYLDATHTINRIMLIPDATFFLAIVMTVCFEMRVGKNNRNLAYFDNLYSQMMAKVKKSSEFTSLIESNEIILENAKADACNQFTDFNKFLKIKMNWDEICDFVFCEIGEFIEKEKCAANDYTEAVEQTFNGVLKKYLISNDIVSPDTVFGIFATQDDFDKLLKLSEEKLANKIESLFIDNMKSCSFTNENEFFCAGNYCRNINTTVSSNVDAFLKQISFFQSNEKTLECLKKNGLLTFENGEKIGINIKNWWYFNALLANDNSDCEIRKMIEYVVCHNDVELTFKLFDYPKVTTNKMIFYAKSFNYDNYSTKSIEIIGSLRSHSCTFMSKMNEIEFMALSFKHIQSDFDSFKTIIEESKFIENYRQIKSTYDKKKEEMSETLLIARKVLVEYIMNYDGAVFEIDNDAIYELFQEYEFSLDEKGLKNLSRILALILYKGKCEYRKAFQIIRAGFDGGEKYNFNELKVDQNDLRRIVYRIERKRKMLDDISKE